MLTKEDIDMLVGPGPKVVPDDRFTEMVRRWIVGKFFAQSEVIELMFDATSKLLSDDMYDDIVDGLSLPDDEDGNIPEVVLWYLLTDAPDLMYADFQAVGAPTLEYGGCYWFGRTTYGDGLEYDHHVRAAFAKLYELEYDSERRAYVSKVQQTNEVQ